MFTLRLDDLSGAPTRALLALHLAGVHAHSPAECVHALDLSGLMAPGMRVWTAWGQDESGAEAIAAIGALKCPGDGTGEIKSMRTHPAFLRRGAAAALLDHIIATARAEGLARLNLETGSGEAFEPALALYRRRGFRPGPVFSHYIATDFNQFLYLDLVKTGVAATSHQA